MGWGPCPSCGEERLGSTTYPEGIAFYPDARGAYLEGVTEVVGATEAMLAGEFACKACGWTGRLRPPATGVSS